MTRKHVRGMPKETAHSSQSSTQKAQARFLSAFSSYGIVSKACQWADISRRTFYNWKDADEEFCKAFEYSRREYEDSIEERLQAECDKRAFAGSDVLLMFRLKKLNPSYRERWSGEIKVKNVDNEAEMHAKLAATAEGRELIRRMSAIMEEGGE